MTGRGRRSSQRPDGDEARRPVPPDEVPAAPGSVPPPEAQGETTGAMPELARLQGELEEERRRAGESWDKYLRAEADLDNLRKRNVKLREEAVERTRRDVLARFLDVADNLERALSHGATDPNALMAGVEGTWRELLRLMAAEGVERMEAQGAPFDPELHDAICVVDVPGGDDERVLSVERAGYTIRGELLRAARVVVARAAASPGSVGDVSCRPPDGDRGA